MSRPPSMPGYWMDETSGVLAPVVHAYLRGEALDGAQLATFRAYLRQWVLDLPGAGAMKLRLRIDDLVTTEALRKWLYDALDDGIDPL